jgi:hypothetical protein
MRELRWYVAAALGVALAAPAWARAQTVTVQGQVQDQPHAQPAYGQPPPGFGQAAYGQPAYGQPGYGAPTYAPTYVQPRPQVTYVDRERSMNGLWIPGLVLFGVSWGLTGSLAALSWDTDYVSYGWIPVVGPWLMLAEASNDDETTGAILGGVAQLAGLTMFVLGLTLRETDRAGGGVCARIERAGATARARAVAGAGRWAPRRDAHAFLNGEIRTGQLCEAGSGEDA